MNEIIFFFTNLNLFFYNDENLIGLLVLPIFSFIYWGNYFLYIKKLKKVVHLSQISLIYKNQSRKKLFLKHLLIYGGFIFLIIAFMRPKWGFKEKIVDRSGIDIVILVDVSNSMLVEDMKPNRLESAKLSILNLLESIDDTRVGLVVFSGSSYILSPLTRDYGTLMNFVRSINTKIVSKQGTDLALGLRTALKAFGENNSLNKDKVLLLFTDGENHKSDVFTEGETAKNKEVKIFSIGVGTGNGEFIPLKNDQGTVINFLKDSENNPIVSKLDQSTLIELSQLTGGSYYFTKNGFLGLDRIYNEIRSLGKNENSQETLNKKQEKYQGFLIVAWIIFLIEMLLSTRKTNYSFFRKK